MDFPEPFKLRPGMSHPLKVVFCPLKLQLYSDHIEVFCNDSSFLVPVQAFTPATRVELPASLDFGCVPTKETVTRQISIRNTGDVRVRAEWRLDPPFSITPSSGSLAPGECSTFDVSFHPTEACSYDARAACQLESGPTSVVKTPSIDFGPVVVGRSSERVIRCGNHSIVPAHFTILHSSGAQDGVFTVTPSKGTLGPEEFTALRITFTPRHSGTFSCETFSMSTAGGNKATLVLRGEASAPHVSFSTRAFNFGNVPSGTMTSRVLYIQNRSEVPVPYDFLLEDGDTFSISRPRGVLPAASTAHVTVIFRSTAPKNHWRRVVCLLKDADPLSVDLLATSYDDKARPPPLSHRHVSSYLSRVMAGGPPVDDAIMNGHCAPAAEDSHVTVAAPDLNVHMDGDLAMGPSEAEVPSALSLLGVEAAVVDTSGAHTLLPGGQLSQLTQPVRSTPTLFLIQCVPCCSPGPDGWDLFFHGHDPARAITLDCSTLDFGTCGRLSASEIKSLVVTNRTSAKVTLSFTVPLWQDPSGGGAGAAPAGQVFQMYPDAADIKPFGSSTFRIAFRPPKDGCFYSQTITVNASVKSMRNFRLVLDHQVVPPWSVPLLACGNTFLHCHPEHAPKVEVSHSQVAFPPCRVGHTQQQTLMLTNYGDTPVHFSLATAALTPHFRVRPELGVIPSKGHVLLGLQFSPSDDKPASGTALIILNHIAMNAIELLLKGSAHIPRITFDLGSTLYFRPTCVGASSSRALVVHNRSRVPVSFEWQVPKRLHGIVSVVPAKGTLRGNESMPVLWSFVPTSKKLYDCKATCKLHNPPGPNTPRGDLTGVAPFPSHGALPAATGSSSSSMAAPGGFSSSEGVELTLVGEGTTGAVALDPPTLGFGTLQVISGSQHDRDLRQQRMATAGRHDASTAALEERRAERLLDLSATHSTAARGSAPEQGAESVAVSLELSNTGGSVLPAAWELSSFDDPDVEQENWVEPSRPLDDAEVARDFITQHRLFDVRPRRGVLLPGDSASVTFTYRPEFSGAHELPMFLHISDGKRLRVQLTAETVPQQAGTAATAESGEAAPPPPPKQQLLLLHSDRTFVFDAVPIGEEAPPLQLFCLRNAGPGSLTYAIDLRPLAAMREANWGCEVVSLESEPQGEIPPYGMAPLNWRFAPLGATAYSVVLNVLLGDGSSQAITLQGRGFHPLQPLDSSPLPGEGGRRWDLWPGFSTAATAGMSGRLAVTSHDVIGLGTTLVRGLTRRIILLTNTSRYPLMFRWDLGCFTDRNLHATLRVSPAAGTLGPGERAVVRLSFEAQLLPQLLEGEISCIVQVDEAVLYSTGGASMAASAANASRVSFAQASSEDGLEDDTIAVDPVKQYTYARGSRLRSRLPIHQYMTVATRTRTPVLDQQFNRSLVAAEAARIGACSPPPLPLPQTITVLLSGRILTEAQVKGVRGAPAAVRQPTTGARHASPLTLAPNVMSHVLHGPCWVAACVTAPPGGLSEARRHRASQCEPVGVRPPFAACVPPASSHGPVLPVSSSDPPRPPAFAVPSAPRRASASPPPSSPKPPNCWPAQSGSPPSHTSGTCSTSPHSRTTPSGGPPHHPTPWSPPRTATATPAHPTTPLPTDHRSTATAPMGHPTARAGPHRGDATQEAHSATLPSHGAPSSHTDDQLQCPPVLTPHAHAHTQASPRSDTQPSPQTASSMSEHTRSSLHGGVHARPGARGSFVNTDGTSLGPEPAKGFSQPQQQQQQLPAAGEEQQAGGRMSEQESARLTPTPPLPPPPLPAASRADQSLSAAVFVLEQLMTELVQDPLVQFAFTTLEPETIPYWATVRSTGVPRAYKDSTIAAAAAAAAAAAEAAASAPASEPSRDSPTQGESLGEGTEPSSSNPSKSSSTATAGSAAATPRCERSDVAPRVGVVQPGEEPSVALSEQQLVEVLMRPAFQVFAEYVLESALMALIQESVAGDWES
ncbi:MAG: hypothetical protein WDW36_009343 [Sanguina aurantia]